jgi:hypothetical protein
LYGRFPYKSILNPLAVNDQAHISLALAPAWSSRFAIALFLPRTERGEATVLVQEFDMSEANSAE